MVYGSPGYWTMISLKHLPCGMEWGEAEGWFHSAEELKDFICIPPPGPWPKAALLFLDCSFLVLACPPLPDSVQFSRSVVSDSLRPHELQHTRPPCPSQTPGVHPNSCPWSWWCHPTISSSVVPFSSRLQSFPASGSFQMSHLFAWGGPSTGVSASASVLPVNTQDWAPLGWTGWISLRSKGLSPDYKLLELPLGTQGKGHRKTFVLRSPSGSCSPSGCLFFHWFYVGAVCWSAEAGASRSHMCKFKS